MNRKKLGRGLQALLGVEEEGESALGLVVPNAAPAGELRPLSVEEIDLNPYQPRRDFDGEELASLAGSISVHGVIQPVVVRPVNGRFQLVAGERRLRAAQQAGLKQIPARIIELDEQQTFEVALVENLQRRDLNAIEKAQAFQGYIARFATTHEELATHLGVDRTTVTNLMRLLELPEPVQDAVRIGQITFGHARAILSLEDSVSQIELCRRIVAEALSVRQTEAIVRERRAPAPTDNGERSKPAAAPKSNHIVSLENELRQRFGTKVEIRPTAKDRGTILIHFHSNDDFERVVSQLGAAAL